jgi:type II secretory pathway pseudopilin PulG
MRRSRQGTAGFTYIGLLIMVAILAVAVSATVQLGAVAQRRDAERELLYVGEQLQKALFTYASRAPGGMPRLPRELSDLLRDPRQPSIVVRHLRRIPIDPITGKADWALLRTPDGFITGVHSASDARPIKVANFDPTFSHFEGAVRYSDWVFGLDQLPKQPSQTSSRN